MNVGFSNGSKHTATASTGWLKSSKGEVGEGSTLGQRIRRTWKKYNET
jgi:hypothetical protein